MENLNNNPLDIIIYLAQYVKSNQGKVGDLLEVSEDLRELGFSEQDIKKAYLWFLNKLPKLFKPEKKKSSLYGWLKAFKDEHFSPESYGFLYQIEELGLLNPEEMEILIQKSLSLGKKKLDIRTVKNLTNLLFFSDNSLKKGIDNFFWMGQEGM